MRITKKSMDNYERMNTEVEEQLGYPCTNVATIDKFLFAIIYLHLNVRNIFRRIFSVCHFKQQKNIYIHERPKPISPSFCCNQTYCWANDTIDKVSDSQISPFQTGIVSQHFCLLGAESSLVYRNAKLITAPSADLRNAWSFASNPHDVFTISRITDRAALST
jgi:hypothetical protein